MTGLVQELQRDALSKDVKIEDLLRKAKAVAVKLGQTEIQAWLNAELEGYRNVSKEQIPAYRHVYAQLKGFNPYQGWLPIVLKDDELDELINSRHLTESIASLSHLIDRDSNGPFALNLAPSNAAIIQKAIDEEVEIKNFVERGAIVSILDAIRTKVLEWALELEKSGIKGENMSFSASEKNAAATITIANIENFAAGAIGHIGAGTTIHVDQTIGVKSEIIGQIASLISDLRAKQTDLPLLKTLQPEIDAIQNELSGKRNPTAIKATLSSMKNILEGAAGSALAASSPEIVHFIERLGKLIGLI